MTVVGLGTWAIGGPWEWGWGKQDDDASVATIREALDLGVNWIDTAPCYGLGHAEEIVAQALGKRRPEVFLASKCGQVWDDNGNLKTDNHPKSIRKECEQSLLRLRTEWMDLYQIHWPDENIPVEESWGELTRLKEEGKVRFIGVSNFDTELLEKCEAIRHVQSLQPPYNLIDRNIEKDILPWCRSANTGLLAYGPLSYGLLTGKFSKNGENQPASDDWRHGFALFQDPLYTKVLDYVDRLREIASNHEGNLAQFALAWVISRPGTTAAIVGARNPEQIRQTIASPLPKIEANEKTAVEKAYHDCLANVTIPGV